jgi:hypothetical protein
MRNQNISARLLAAALACALSLAACGGDPAANENSTRPRAEATATAATPAATVEATPAATAEAAASPTATPSPGEAAPEPGEHQEEDFRGTVGAVEKEGGGVAPALLRVVRTASREKFDRVVFEFEGARLPGYHVEYVDRPVRQCGSGEVVPVAGDAWLRVRLTPANAHTEAGEATVKDRARRLNYPNLKELKSLCDFEAEVEWVLGLASPNRYRVLELTNPARLVIDVKK